MFPEPPLNNIPTAINVRMRKIIISTVIFVVVTSLVLATNGIPWDETPLEQSILALPLGLGFLLELPFLVAMAILTGNGSGTGLLSYDLHPVMTRVIPFVVGASYSGLFYLIAYFAQRTLKQPVANSIIE